METAGDDDTKSLREISCELWHFFPLPDVPSFFIRDFSHFWHGCNVLFSFPESCNYSWECSRWCVQMPQMGLYNTADVISDTHTYAGTYIFSIYTHAYMEFMPKTLLITISYNHILGVQVNLVSSLILSVSSQKWKTEKRKEWKKGSRCKSDAVLPRKRACSRSGRCRAQSSRTLWSTTISVMKITAILHLSTHINNPMSPCGTVRFPFPRIVAAIFVVWQQ